MRLRCLSFHLNRANVRATARNTAAALVSVLLVTSAAAAAPKPRPSDPVLTIPLEPLGFTGVPSRFLLTSSTMFTVNFVDETHLLFTYNARTLMPRLPDPDPMDDDRNVAAVLLELPSGKVLARAEFRTRDHDRYLWPLTHGRFLLRSRNRLSVIAPLADLASGQPFRQLPFADLGRTIGLIAVSPEGDLVTVETIPKRRPPARLTGAAASTAALAGTVPASKSAVPAPIPEPEADDPMERRDPVQIHFYRLLQESAPKGDTLIVQSAGFVYSPRVISIPATADGFITQIKESAQSWDFDFNTHGGKKTELAVFDSSCSPTPLFITRSDFVAYGCRGVDGQSLGGFNLRGEHNWIFAFSDHALAPTLVTAPAAGRFALSRTIVSPSLIDQENLVPELVTGQEVNVLQDHDGRVLLKVQTTPIQRSGQNFDLSPDGMRLVTVRDGNLNLYQLPPLNGKDQSELKREIAAYPERSSSPILLGSTAVESRRTARAEGVPLGAEVLPPAPAQTPPADASAASAPKAPTADSVVVGDPVPGESRQAPSLYDADHPRPAKPE